MTAGHLQDVATHCTTGHIETAETSICNRWD